MGVFSDLDLFILEHLENIRFWCTRPRTEEAIVTEEGTHSSHTCRHVSSAEATDDEEEMHLVKKKLTNQQGTRTQPNRGYAQQQNKKVRDKTKVDCGYLGSNI